MRILITLQQDSDGRKLCWYLTQYVDVPVIYLPLEYPYVYNPQTFGKAGPLTRVDCNRACMFALTERYKDVIILAHGANLSKTDWYFDKKIITYEYAGVDATKQSKEVMAAGFTKPDVINYENKYLIKNAVCKCL